MAPSAPTKRENVASSSMASCWEVSGGRWQFEGVDPAADWRVAAGRWRFKGAAPTSGVQASGQVAASSSACGSGRWEILGGRWQYKGVVTSSPSDCTSRRPKVSLAN